MQGFFVGHENMQDDEVLVMAAKSKHKKHKSAADPSSSMVEKNYDALSPSDIEKHWDKDRTAMRKELSAFAALNTFKRMTKSLAKNNCTSRWVLRWKDVDGERVVKAR